MSAGMPADPMVDGAIGIALPLHRAVVLHNGIDPLGQPVLEATGVAVTPGDHNAVAIAMSSPKVPRGIETDLTDSPGRVTAGPQWKAVVTDAPNTATGALIAHAARCLPTAISMARPARMADVVRAAGGTVNGGATAQALAMKAMVVRRATANKAADTCEAMVNVDKVRRRER